MQPARYMRKQAAAQAQAITGGTLGEVFHFNQRHVDVGFTFALATFAANTQIHGFGQFRVSECYVRQLAVECRFQQTYSPAGGKMWITRDPVAGTHHLLAIGFALAAVDAHRHRFGEIAAGFGDVGISVAHPGVFVG